jgi:hypothetical protein
MKIMAEIFGLGFKKQVYRVRPITGVKNKNTHSENEMGASKITLNLNLF